MSPDDGAGRGPMPLGPVGGYVIANLTDLREARRLTYRELSERLRAIGRPIPPLGLSRIEKGQRRVDADDLVALALALGVNPSALLLPRDVAQRDVVTLTEEQKASAGDAWAWADGRRPLPFAGPFTRSTMDLQAAVDFAARARPEWAPPEALQALGLARQPIVAAIVTSAKGILVTRRADGNPPWGFVTGEVEPGEDAVDACVREVKEETSLEVRIGRHLGERIHPATGRHMIYYAAHPVGSTKVIVGDEAELAEVKWVSLTEALGLLPSMFAPVREYLEAEL